MVMYIKYGALDIIMSYMQCTDVIVLPTSYILILPNSVTLQRRLATTIHLFAVVRIKNCCLEKHCSRCSEHSGRRAIKSQGLDEMLYVSITECIKRKWNIGISYL